MWLLGWDSPRHLSVIWRYIFKLMPGFRGKIRWAVGKGNRTLFWMDKWLGETPLQSAFPRLYNLVRNSQAYIRDVVAESSIANIDWSSIFRRELRDSEAIEFSTLDTVLQNFYRDPSIDDELIWTPSTNGRFSVASSYSCLLDRAPHTSRKAWDLPAPPKVRFFLWSVLHGKILTRDNLARRGASLPSLECPICRGEPETIRHLLIDCSFAQRIWVWFVELFGFSWGSYGSLDDIMGIQPPNLSPVGRHMWRSSVAFIPWAIWEERNKRVFQGRSSQWIEVATNIQTRIIQWLSVTDKLGEFDSATLRASWTTAATVNASLPPTIPAVWAPPPLGKLKLNFDGSSLGNPGPAGYGGVFRDHTGTIQLSYAGPVGHDDSTSAEVHGILFGLRHFQCHLVGELEVEGDSSNVIGWCRQTSTPPWRFLYQFREIFCRASACTISWTCIPRAANSVADLLAREGVHLPTDTVRMDPPYL